MYFESETSQKLMFQENCENYIVNLTKNSDTSALWRAEFEANFGNF